MTVYTLSKAYTVLQETLFQDRYFVMNLTKRYWTAVLCRTPMDSCYCILLNAFFVCEKSWIYVNVALFYFHRYICWREIFDAYSNFCLQRHEVLPMDLRGTSTTTQARNKELFGEGKVSWNWGISINVSCTAYKRKTPEEKNLTHRSTKSIFFQNQGFFLKNQGNYFLFSKRGRGDLLLHPASCTPGAKAFLCTYPFHA